MALTQEKIHAALKTITVGNSDLISTKMVQHITIKDGRVGFALEVSNDNPKAYEALRLRCIEVVEAIDGVREVTVALTHKRKTEHEPPQRKKIPGVKHIIVVASGKGGVGKSTIAANLARHLSQSQRVGILDADIYGPSIPLMFDAHEKPEIDAHNRMVPITKDGIQLISIGNLVDADKATIWRGSMATKALFQLFQGTAWDRVDTLIVDLPPGTGDIHLTIAKNYVIDGALLVSTPHDLALADLKKGANMFEKVGIPVLGVVENMSYFEDLAGQKHYLFGEPKIKDFANENDYTYLGDIAILQEHSESHSTANTYQRIIQQITSHKPLD